jgi:DNA topoisomerase-1
LSKPETTEAGLVNPQEAAESAGLIYVTDQMPGIMRRRAREKFAYTGVDRKPVTSPDILGRIRKLAIPPGQ